MHIVCPHCHNPIEVVKLTPREEITCSACGSSFRLETEATTGSENSAGWTVGRFVLIETVGQGGFGTVYKARDPELDRVVAIKVPRSGNLAGPQELDRFLREARSVAQLRHPSIVSVHEVGQQEGVPYLVSDFVRGVTLADLLSARRPGFREAAELVAVVAEALQYAHEQGVVHRDVKPSNIMIGEDGRPCVMDFGLARRETGEITMTIEGQVLGTPAYMSPEQARGEGHTADARSDVYSLGVVLYQLLTGELPFRGTKAMVLHQVEHDEPRAPRGLNDHIPRDLETITVKAMAKEPERRYPTAQALAEDLRHWLNGAPIRARPVGIGERALKWARGRPAIATLAAMLAIVTVVGFAGIIREWQIAEGEWQRAEGESRKQASLRDAAEWQSYLRTINLAHTEWRLNNARRAEDLLASCPPGLRGWEWHYLRRLFRLRQIETMRAHAGAVTAVAFSPGGDRVAFAVADGTVRVWDRQGHREVFVLRGHEGAATAVGFSPDGRRLASGGVDRTVRLWDASSGQEALAPRAHAVAVTSVAFSPDGRCLASAGGEPGRGEVKLWDVVTGKELGELSNTEPIVAVGFSPDGRRLAVAQPDAVVRVLDAATLSQVVDLQVFQSVHGDAGARWSGVAYSANGQYLAAVSSDGVVKVWAAGAAPDHFTNPFTGTEDMGFAELAFQPQDKKGPAPGYLAMAGADGTVSLRYPENGRVALVLRGHAGPVTAVAFSPDGRCLASASRDETVKLWDVTRREDNITLRSASHGCNAAAFSPDGRRVATASQSRYVMVWDAETGSKIMTLKGHKGEVSGVAFSADGEQIATGSWDKTVRLWDAITGQSLSTLTGHTDRVEGLAFSSTGGLLASAGADGTVRLWDAAAAREVLCVKGHSGPVVAVAFSRDGRRLASASRDGTVKLWDAASGHEQLTLSGHAGGTCAVSFAPGGGRIASAGQDERVRIWNAVTGDEVRILAGHTDAVRGVAFTPDGRRLASTGDDRTVKLWDPDTGEEILTLRGHADGVRGVAFSPDGHCLASAGADRAVVVWDGTPDDARSWLEKATQAHAKQPPVFWTDRLEWQLLHREAEVLLKEPPPDPKK